MTIWVKIGLALALVAALGFAKSRYDDGIYQQGYSKAKGEADAREKRISEDAAKRLAQATAEAKAREEALRQTLSDVTTLRYKEGKQHEKDIEKYRAAARAGDEWLRITVRNCNALPGSPTPEGTGLAAGHGGEARADVVPGVADVIFGIAGGIAKSVRDYNDLLTLYNVVRQTCNAE